MLLPIAAYPNLVNRLLRVWSGVILASRERKPCGMSVLIRDFRESYETRSSGTLSSFQRIARFFCPAFASRRPYTTRPQSAFSRLPMARGLRRTPSDSGSRLRSAACRPLFTCARSIAWATVAGISPSAAAHRAWSLGRDMVGLVVLRRLLRRLAIFISSLHPRPGTEHLVVAWPSRHAPRRPPIWLTIAFGLCGRRHRPRPS